jgi:hypothetical protein
VRLASGWARGHQWRARALAHDGQLEAAVDAAIRATSDRSSWAALLLLSSLREISGEDLLAQDAAEKALRMAPEEPRLLRSHARIQEAEREFEGAADAWRRAAAAARASPSPDARFAEACERAVRDCARLSKLDERWEEIESGKLAPQGAAELILCAEVAACREEFALAGRLLGQALEKDDAPAGSERDALLLTAAVNAARAGGWEGAGGFNISDEAAAELRGRALGWSRELLESLRKRGGGREVLWEVARWKMLASLSGVRDREGLERFPDDEAKDWTALWGDVDRLHRQLRKGGAR